MLRPTKAIIVGSVIVGICSLSNLGYAVFRDQAELRDKEQQAKIAAERYKKAQSKEAWKKALHFIDVDFRHWLEKEIKPNKNEYVDIGSMMVKTFELSDIRWDSETDVTVRSLLCVEPSKGTSSNCWYSWARKMHFGGDGVDYDWVGEDIVFQGTTITKEREKSLPIIPIFYSGQDGFTSPMVR